MFDPLAVMCLEIWGHSTINRYQPSLQGLRFTGGPAWHCDDPNSSRSLALGEPHKQRCFGNWQDTSTVPERCSVSQSIHSCFRHADVKHSEFCAWICPSSKLWAPGFCWPWRKRAIDFRLKAAVSYVQDLTRVVVGASHFSQQLSRTRKQLGTEKGVASYCKLQAWWYRMISHFDHGRTSQLSHHAFLFSENRSSLLVASGTLQTSLTNQPML